MRTEIIYEDKDILVVYKPAGLATQTAKLGQPDVVSELQNYLVQGVKGAGQGAVSGRGVREAGGEIYVGIVHRLDQPVEGLLVFAKHKKAAADLTAQLQRQGEGRALHKHYYAVVCRKPAHNQGRLVDYMYKSPENLAVIVEQEKCGAVLKETAGKIKSAPQSKQNQGEIQIKKAILEYKILKRWESAAGQGSGQLLNNAEGDCVQELALADINIFTGRFHQIRAQMAHAGMPLLGDAKYGSSEAKELAKALGVQTVALCAYSLEFQHPTTKKALHFEEKPRGKAFGFF